MSTDYRLFETNQFQKDMEKLVQGGKKDLPQKLIDQVYPQLRLRPHFGPHIKKLRNFEPETWRYRIGPWRFFYEIDESERIVFLTAASHRSRAY